MQKQRDYLFDNLKLLLIVSVVLAHLVSGSTKQNPMSGYIYYIIYGFHMPFFIFITGYFTKDVSKARENAFTSTLIPFLIFNALYGLSFADPDYLDLFRIQRNFWFLLCIFYWKFILKDFIRIRFALVVSFVLALGIGLFPRPGDYLCISRAVVLFPFFLLGYYCTPKHIQMIRDLSKKITGPTLIACFAFMCFLYQTNHLKKSAFYFRNAYEYIGYSNTKGLIVRVMLMVVAIVISICLINLLPNKNYKITKWGANTFAIYIGHTFAIQWLRDRDFFKLFNNNFIEIISYLLLTALMVAIFGSPWFSQVFDRVKECIRKVIMIKEPPK